MSDLTSSSSVRMSFYNGGHAEIKRERGSKPPLYSIHVEDSVNHKG